MRRPNWIKKTPTTLDEVLKEAGRRGVERVVARLTGAPSWHCSGIREYLFGAESVAEVLRRFGVDLLDAATDEETQDGAHVLLWLADLAEGMEE